VHLVEQAATKLPAKPESQFHLGTQLYKVGRRDDAIGALQRAAAGSPSPRCSRRRNQPTLPRQDDV
jgi:hypothetical protein